MVTPVPKCVSVQLLSYKLLLSLIPCSNAFMIDLSIFFFTQKKIQKEKPT